MADLSGFTYCEVQFNRDGTVFKDDEVTALLDALDADVTLVHNDDDDATLAPLRQKGQVVKLSRDTPVDEAVVQLLRMLGRPEEAASLN